MMRRCQVKEGVHAAGKHFSEVDVAAYTSFSVHEDLKKATKVAVPVVSFIVAGSPSMILERYGISLGKAEEIRGALKACDWGRAFGAVSLQILKATYVFNNVFFWAT